MKKIYSIMAAMLLTAAAMAQSASDVRIYINPGHGSWGPNDRPMATIPYPNLETTGRPDTCGFYESNTDLWKCLKLGETLEKMGVQKKNIMYSRRLNGPYPYVAGASDATKYNRSLSEISAEVDANNMDFFISVHSNAATDGTTTNYPLILYRGEDGSGGDYASGSRDFSIALWAPHYMDELDPQSAYSRTNMNIRGDVSFYHSSSTSSRGYTGYLGVLKHGVTGCLVEGFFHTYQPARHRALNKDYCAQEGVRLARGFCEYLSLTPEKTGYIMGTVKDMHTKIVNSLFNYAPGTNDQWLPLNGAKVLLKKDGETVDTYSVDQCYNGIFVFSDVEPGTYTLEVEAEGYKPLTDEYKDPITVKANATSYVKLLVESESYVPPVITYDNYPEPEQPAYLKVPAQFQFSRSSSSYTGIEGTVKRAIVRGDSAVVLAESNGAAALYLINLKTSTLEKTLSTSGIIAKDADNAGDYSELNDIAFTADGKLIGINYMLNQYSAGQVDDGYKRGTLRVYKWENLGASPTLWVSTQTSGNFYRAAVGKTLAVSGESKECTLITTARTTGTSKAVRMILLNIVDNSITSTIFTEKTISDSGNFTENKQGEDMQLTVSPLADDQFVIDGSLTLPQEFKPAQQSGTDSQILSTFAESSSYTVGAAAKGVSFFKYGGSVLMAAPYMNGTTVGGLRLYDVSSGLDKATPVAINGTSTVTSSAEPFMASGSKVDGADLTLYLFVDKKIVKYTTVNTAQPAVKRISAYNLRLTEGDGEYIFGFTTNSKPTAASVIFYNPTTGDALDSVALTTLRSGTNSLKVSADKIPFPEGGNVKWAVKLKGTPVTTIARLNSSGSTTSYSGRLFCAVDNSPESERFGYVYAMNYVSSGSESNGLYAYTPTWARVNSSPYRGTAGVTMGYRISVGDNGKVYMSDYSDSNSGVYVADPLSLSGEFTQFFTGTRASSGLISNGSTNVGSSTPCVTVANGKMYCILEDFGNNIGIYNIGTGETAATSWSKAPSKTLSVGSLLANGNGTVIPGPDGGVWVSQLRYKPNNTAGVPSLIYANASGKVVFNSGSDSFADQLNGSCCGAVAVSRDGKLLVIADGDGVLQFFDLTWSGGVPTLTPKYSFTPDVQNSSDHNSIYQIQFDYSGNLICSGSELGIYSIPDAANEVVIPARTSQMIVNSIGTPTVDKAGAIAYDAASRTLTSTLEGGITVYDTAGAVVLKSAGSSLALHGLAPGVYVAKSTGNAKALKFIVR